MLFKVRFRMCTILRCKSCSRGLQLLSSGRRVLFPAPHSRLLVTSLQAEHLTSCYWGGSSNPTERHDPSLPYLEQYRIDIEQFKGLFKQLFPWANGAQSDLLAVRFFRLLDQNCDGLINFREFINGLGRRNFVFFRTFGAVIRGRFAFPVCFSGVLYHGDLIEKLKLLYKMHVMPGGCAAQRH